MTPQYGVYALRADWQSYMHVYACTRPRVRVPTCTHAHTDQYVTLTAFQQQQWFQCYVIRALPVLLNINNDKVCGCTLQLSILTFICFLDYQQSFFILYVRLEVQYCRRHVIYESSKTLPGMPIGILSTHYLFLGAKRQELEPEHPSIQC